MIQCLQKGTFASCLVLTKCKACHYSLGLNVNECLGHGGCHVPST
jgi:hypothetical protein